MIDAGDVEIVQSIDDISHATLRGLVAKLKKDLDQIVESNKDVDDKTKAFKVRIKEFDYEMDRMSSYNHCSKNLYKMAREVEAGKR